MLTLSALLMPSLCGANAGFVCGAVVAGVPLARNEDMGGNPWAASVSGVRP